MITLARSLRIIILELDPIVCSRYRRRSPLDLDHARPVAVALVLFHIYHDRWHGIEWICGTGIDNFIAVRSTSLTFTPQYRAKEMSSGGLATLEK